MNIKSLTTSFNLIPNRGGRACSRPGESRQSGESTSMAPRVLWMACEVQFTKIKGSRGPTFENLPTFYKVSAILA
jgi:hypothetical protein